MVMACPCPCPVSEQETPLMTKYPIMPVGTIFESAGVCFQVIKPINRVFYDLKGLWESPVNWKRLSEDELTVFDGFKRNETFILPTFERLVYLFLLLENIAYPRYFTLKGLLHMILTPMPHLSESTWQKGEKWEKTHKYQSYLIQSVNWTYKGYKPSGKIKEWTHRGQVFIVPN